jgi:hypothetical protein
MRNEVTLKRPDVHETRAHSIDSCAAKIRKPYQLSVEVLVEEWVSSWIS